MNGPRGLATPMAKVCAGISEGKMDLRRICAICAVCAFQVDPGKHVGFVKMLHDHEEGLLFLENAASQAINCYCIYGDGTCNLFYVIEILKGILNFFLSLNVYYLPSPPDHQINNGNQG